MRYPLLVTVVLGLSTGGTVRAQGENRSVQLADRGPAFFSVAHPGEVRVDARHAAVLRRFVALELTDVTVLDALQAVERAAAVHIVYPETLIPADVRVTVRAERISLDAALTAVLHDVPADVQLLDDAVLVLVRRGGAVIVPVTGHQQGSGAIVGRVIDAKSGRGIGNATVNVAATNARASTDTGGQFRVRGVRPGAYDVVARFLGYRSLTQRIEVHADSTAEADFALEKSVQQLDEVVTTGTVVPTEVKALPTPVSVISDSEIALQHPHTIQEVFRQAIPTAVSWDYTAYPAYTSFSVRGTSTLSGAYGQIKVFVDGIEAANGTISSVDPTSIERVEVIRGPKAAAIYGSDASGGVMEIFTKRGDTTLTRPQVDAQGAFSLIQTPYAGYGGVLRQGYTASVRGGGSGASYNLGAGYSHTNDYVPGGEISRQSTPSVYGGMHFARGIVIADVFGRYYVQNNPNAFNPGLSQTGFSFFSRPFYQPTQYENRTVGAKFTILPTDWWRNTVTVGLDQLSDNTTQTRPRLTTQGDTLLTVSYSSESKASVGYNTSIQGSLGGDLSGSLTAGFDHYTHPATGWSTGSALNTTGAIQTAPGRSVSSSWTVTNNTGYFVQAQLGLRDVLFLTGGLRAEQNTNFGDSLGTPVSPRVGLSFVQALGAATLKMRASWGSAIRAPDPGEKAALVSRSGTVILANPGLGPERQHGWDTGLDAVFGARGSLSVTYYDQLADDLIDFVPIQVQPVPTSQYQNVGRVKNTGMELEGAMRLGLLQLKGQYGYTRSRVEQLAVGYTGDLRVGDQTLATPKHTAGASLSVAPLTSTAVSAGLTYVGSWNYYDDLTEFRCFGGTGPCPASLATGSTRDFIVAYPAFVKVNATVTQQLTPFLSGFVSVDNVTDKRTYELSNIYPIMGRIATVGFRFSH